MLYLQIVIRVAMLAISMYGYMCIASEYIKLDLVPGFMFSCIGSLLFVAGILNILQEITWIVWAGGIYCLTKSARENKQLKLIMTPGVFLFVALSAFFLLILYQSKFVHYDDFSHWGVVAKVVCQRDNFPNAANKNVEFQSYPLGSTCFIYYITEIIGIHSEWLQMLAQAVLMAGMAISLFAFCKTKIQLILAGITVVFLLCCNISFVNLLVDTLLPLTGFAALSFCLYYKDEIIKKIYYLIPYIVFLTSIKNSGALFAIFTMLWVLLFMEKQADSLKRWLKVAASPVVVLYFWKQHVEQSFDNGVFSKHSMTLENLWLGFSYKTGEDVAFITRKFITTMWHDSHLIFMLLGCCCMVWLFARCCNKEREKEIRNVILFVCASYFIYQFGMLGMYLFSMPGIEAYNLAGYPRYHKTILIYDVAILVLVALMAMEDKSSVLHRTAKCIFAAIIVFFAWNILSPNLYNYQRQSLRDSERVKFDCLIDDYRIESGHTYIVIVSEERDDAGYLHYLTQYLLSPEKMDICKDSQLEEYYFKTYDYVIMFEETETARNFLLEEYGTVEPVICQIDWEKQ